MILIAESGCAVVKSQGYLGNAGSMPEADCFGSVTGGLLISGNGGDGYEDIAQLCHVAGTYYFYNFHSLG
jgi:transcriptional regulator of aromatic amino acid metabolism